MRARNRVPRLVFAFHARAEGSAPIGTNTSSIIIFNLINQHKIFVYQRVCTSSFKPACLCMCMNMQWEEIVSC